MTDPGEIGAAPLPPALAYRLWAPDYERETALSALEERVVREIGPPTDGSVLLDAACGTARRLRPERARARLAMGVDLVPEMLARAASPEGPRLLVAAADLRRLPFGPGVFDLVWCRLALGHLEDLRGAYRELARVARRGARLIASDVHAAAIAAGHTRTFRDPEGTLRTVEHHVHDPGAHERAAAAAGWHLERAVEAAAGGPERPFYERAGRLDQLERERDLPLVLVLRFQK